MEQIEIEYTLDKETLQKAYRVMIIHADKNYNPWVFIGVWGFTIITVQFISPGLSLSGAAYAIVSLVAILGFIYFFKVYHPDNWANKMTQELGLPKPVQINIKANSIDLKTPSVESTSKWEVFRKILFTEEIIITYFAHKQTLAIPVSAFTPEHLVQFKVWARANVKEVIE